MPAEERLSRVGPGDAGPHLGNCVRVAHMPEITLDSGLSFSHWHQGEDRDARVVFLPGPTDSWRSYQPVLDAVPRALPVVSVSLRGHGDSSKPSSGFGIEDLASDVLPLLDALEIDRALFVAHSASCLIARRVALQAPDRVAGLVLEASPTTLRGDANLLRFVNSVVSQLTDPIDLDFARSFVADTARADLNSELTEQLVEDLRKVPARVWKEMFISLLDYDDRAELSRLHTPVLLVWGDADPLVSRSMQDELARVLPHADLVVYGGARHTPRWEAPVRFANDVTTFASRVSLEGPGHDQPTWRGSSFLAAEATAARTRRV